MKSVLDLLLDKGVEVTVRYERTIAAMPQYRGIKLRPWNRLLVLTKRWLYERGYDRPYSRQIAFLVVFFERLMSFCKFDLVIGVDRHGLIDAYFWSRLTGVPYVFFSFEIMFEAETSAEYKRLERVASSKVKQWFVQDETRAQKLMEENWLNPDNRCIVPLGSAGIGQVSSERLRDRLGIPKYKHVAILIGSLAGWSMTSEILDTVQDWPDDWCIIVHDRYGKTQEYFNQIGLHHGTSRETKIYLSGFAEDRIDNMDGVLSGIDVGLAFYSPDYQNRYTGDNLKHLGLSSGKICTFLRYGIPVIMNRIGAYADLALRFGFGVVVEDPQSITKVLPHLQLNELRANARFFFEKKIDFDIYKEPIWAGLVNIMRRPK